MFIFEAGSILTILISNHEPNLTNCNRQQLNITKNQYSSASEFFTLTVPYRNLHFWDLPFLLFGHKKPYRFPFFLEKRLPNQTKKISFSDSVFYSTVLCFFLLKSANRTVQSKKAFSVMNLHR